MEECKQHIDEPMTYTLYVFGWLLPWLCQQREAGKLKTGKLRQLLINLSRLVKKRDVEQFRTIVYDGEVDQEGKRCGIGKLMVTSNNHESKFYEGTFY